MLGLRGFAFWCADLLAFDQGLMRISYGLMGLYKHAPGSLDCWVIFGKLLQPSCNVDFHAWHCAA